MPREQEDYYLIIYNSMIVWVCTVMFIWETYKVRRIQDFDENKRVPLQIAVLTFGYFIFWAGMRSGVADTAAYISMFNGFGSSFGDLAGAFSNAKAPGFEIVSIIIKMIFGSNYHCWLMIIAIISGVSVMLTLWKHSEHFFFSAYLFITMLDFFWMFNGMRQFIAASLLFLASDLIKEKKLLQFLVVCFLLMTIHYTAVVVIPMYWIVQGKAFNRKTIFFIILVLAAVVFLEPFINTLENILEGTAYSGATSQFVEDDGVNIIRVLVMVVPVLISFICRGLIDQENDSYINICVNMSIACASFYFLGVFTSGILIGRIPIYFELYNLILLPWLLNHCFTPNSRKLIYSICTVCFFMFYYTQMASSYYISELTGLIQ